MGLGLHEHGLALSKWQYSSPLRKEFLGTCWVGQVGGGSSTELPTLYKG